jgi:hypothetical protein
MVVGMGEQDAVASVPVFDRPLDRQGFAGEAVDLQLTSAGDLVLRARTTGRVVESMLGDGAAVYHRWWTVPAARVPELARAAAHHLGVAPAAAGQATLELVRDAMAVGPAEEATSVADRFTRWLAALGVPYGEEERVESEP